MVNQDTEYVVDIDASTGDILKVDPNTKD
ncbi:hypothetical protein ACIQZI_23850 [Peribacillus sp. NPDC096379]